MSLLTYLAFNKLTSEYRKDNLADEPFVNNFNLDTLNTDVLDHILYIVYNLNFLLSSIKAKGYEVLSPSLQNG